MNQRGGEDLISYATCEMASGSLGTRKKELSYIVCLGICFPRVVNMACESSDCPESCSQYRVPAMQRTAWFTANLPSVLAYQFLRSSRSQRCARPGGEGEIPVSHMHQASCLNTIAHQMSRVFEA